MHREMTPLNRNYYLYTLVALAVILSIDFINGSLETPLLRTLASIASDMTISIAFMAIAIISQAVYNYRQYQRDFINADISDICNFTVMNCDFKRLQTTTGEKADNKEVGVMPKAGKR